MRKLTILIGAFKENPKPELEYSIMKCLLELWGSNEPIIVPTYKDDNGNVHLSTTSPKAEEDVNVPMLLTEIDSDGRESNTIIFDEEYLVFFTDERFYIEHKDVTLMYVPFDTLIEHYSENKHCYLGINVNPFHDHFTLQLTNRAVDYLIELKEYRKTEIES
jgi:hypothetical protein